MAKDIVIAVDGQSGTGKSTLARELAKRLNYMHIDSGAMYRAITLYFLENNINWNDPQEVAQALKNIHLQFKSDRRKGQVLHLNGWDVSKSIRGVKIAKNVSVVAAVKTIREFSVAEQRRLGKNKKIVMDGRDIGTTVFPDAELKIFLQADDEVRAQRRFKEMTRSGIDTTIEEVKANLQQRDYIDSHRKISPLRKAADAIVLDNTYLTKEQLLEEAMRVVEKKIKE